MIPMLLAVLGLGALFVLFGLLHLWRGDAPTGRCGGGGNCGACDGSGHCGGADGAEG